MIDRRSEKKFSGVRHVKPMTLTDWLLTPQLCPLHSCASKSLSYCLCPTLGGGKISFDDIPTQKNNDRNLYTHFSSALLNNTLRWATKLEFKFYKRRVKNVLKQTRDLGYVTLCDCGFYCHLHNVWEINYLELTDAFDRVYKIRYDLVVNYARN